MSSDLKPIRKAIANILRFTQSILIGRCVVPSFFIFEPRVKQAA